MGTYKFKCEDRNYQSWSMYDSKTLQEVNITDYNIDPAHHKLMNQDIIEVDDETKIFVQILHSCNREMLVLAGVMSFDKMYGKVKNKQNKYYFKVVPDDARLPVFVVPYTIKKMGFHKKQHKSYVIFKYKDWSGKFPEGELIHTIGSVTELPNFYEYQLYCKSLYSSIQSFTAKTKQALKNSPMDVIINGVIDNPKYCMEDRRGDKWRVIAIDPEGSKDFDDAFGMVTLDKEQDLHMLSIYISNVSVWMDALGLWGSFSRRISTIYLPDRKRPMLPSILSDMLCSLLENETRFAFALDITVQGGKIIKQECKNAVISVTKNYTYEDKRLLNDVTYLKTLDLLVEMNRVFKFQNCDDLYDSHTLIMFLMVLMNYVCAKEFEKHKCGVFRSIKLNYDMEKVPKTLPREMTQFLQTWNSTGGQYLKHENYDGHDLLRLEAYVHITSPIRRLVDLLNMMTLQEKMGIFEMNEDARTFRDDWLKDENIEYINVSMRAIRKMQTQCTFLHMCVNEEGFLEKEYEGYVFDKIKRNDGLYQYNVYIPKLKLMNKYTTRHEHENYDRQMYKLHLMECSESYKKKVIISYA